MLRRQELNLERALDLAQRTKAFAANRHQGMVLLTYLFHDAKLFAKEPLARELRGAVWEEATGELLSRPFHKFYNLGEPLAPRLEGTLSGSGALVAPKVDGFLVQAFLRGKEVVKASRLSLTMGLIADLLRDFWSEEHEAFVRRVSQALGGATLLFELVHPRVKILQEGQRPGLHFLAARSLESGQYWVYLGQGTPDGDGRDLGRAFGPPPPGIQVVYWLPPEEAFGHDPTWEEAHRTVRSWGLRERGWESLEGAVALTQDGELVKLKTLWAFWVAGLLMDPAGTVLRAVAEGREDDLLGLLAGTREDLGNLVAHAVAEVQRQVREGVSLGEEWRGRERKAFWERVIATFYRPHEVLAQRASVMAYEGRPLEAIWEEIRSMLARGNTVERFAAWMEEAHGETLRALGPKGLLEELRG